MKKIWCALPALLALGCMPLLAQGFGFHGKIQNSLYAYEDEQQHFRFYQYVQFSATSPNKFIGLNANLRALTDIDHQLDSDQRFKAYALHLVFKNLFKDRLTVVLGRQFLHPGTAMGALDGVNVVGRLDPRWRLQIFVGGETLPTRAFEIRNPKDHFAAGCLLERFRFYSTDTQLFYLQKSDGNGIYWQIAGLNLTNKYFKDTQIRLQAHYNMQANSFYTLLFHGRRNWSDRLTTQVEYKSQQPRVYANSYFTVFEKNAFQRFRLASDWRLHKNYALEGQYQLLFAEGMTAHRILLGVQDTGGSCHLIYETGDLGDQFGVSVDYGYELMKDFIASLYVDYSRYRTETIYEFDYQIANAARLSYRLGEHWLAVVEYQWLTNRIKKSDSRLLNHIAFRW